jgi:hypothetical protein
VKHTMQFISLNSVEQKYISLKSASFRILWTTASNSRVWIPHGGTYVLLALHEIYDWATLARNTPLSQLRVAANFYVRLEIVEYIRDPVASDLNVIPHTKSHGPHS